MKTFTPAELAVILTDHKNGKIADLSDAYLRGACLSDADLRGACLSYAYLRGADLFGAHLRDADLSYAYLSGADLRSADLRNADLSGAYLIGADLRHADLRDADLSDANLSGADLRGAHLSGACLSHADLSHAYLSDAYLIGAKINWSSHDLIAQILRLAADEDIEKRKIAGLILVSRDWCWPDFEAMQNDPNFDWCIAILAGYVTEDDDAPIILKEVRNIMKEARNGIASHTPTGRTQSPDTRNRE
jgi:hypothetical protein